MGAMVTLDKPGTLAHAAKQPPIPGLLPSFWINQTRIHRKDFHEKAFACAGCLLFDGRIHLCPGLESAPEHSRKTLGNVEGIFDCGGKRHAGRRI
jgi:hypothetical protein